MAIFEGIVSLPLILIIYLFIKLLFYYVMHPLIQYMCLCVCARACALRVCFYSSGKVTTFRWFVDITIFSINLKWLKWKVGYWIPQCEIFSLGFHLISVNSKISSSSTHFVRSKYSFTLHRFGANVISKHLDKNMNEM